MLAIWRPCVVKLESLWDLLQKINISSTSWSVIFASLFLYLSRWDCAVQEITALTYLILTCTRPSASPTVEAGLVWVRLECKSDPVDQHMKICTHWLISENIQPSHFSFVLRASCYDCSSTGRPTSLPSCRVTRWSPCSRSTPAARWAPSARRPGAQAPFCRSPGLTSRSVHIVVSGDVSTENKERWWRSKGNGGENSEKLENSDPKSHREKDGDML